MEFGQILHNNPCGYPAGDFEEALLASLRKAIARVYWNVHQRGWRGAGPGDIGTGLDDADLGPGFETTIPGIVWNDYYNWGGSPDDPDWDQAKADAPNFSFEGVEFRWYKWFGRSLNTNVQWDPAKWHRWFGRCHATIRAFEYEHSTLRHHYPEPLPYPDPAGRVPLDNGREESIG